MSLVKAHEVVQVGTTPGTSSDRASRRSYTPPVLRATRDAFIGVGELTERQGATLVVTSGALFSLTAIAFAAVEDASDFQFLAYRGASIILEDNNVQRLRGRLAALVPPGLRR